MKYEVTYDGVATHLDWVLEGVNATMVDWFWSNMEKAFILWHPAQHDPLEWAVAPKHGNPLGSIHIAPQTWNDGVRQNLYIRMEKLEEVPEEVRKYIIYEHVIIVCGLGLGEECLTNPNPLGYRLHQWERRDYGIIGKSTAYEIHKKNEGEVDNVWAAHCGEEIGNWEVFLPQLYTLYKVVNCPNRNPFTDLSVGGKGLEAKYKYIKQI
ncbi:MAG: hypothetical protein PVI90_08150 [Desulfobacteraceae bacterium]|jgi:hypothetical protein